MSITWTSHLHAESASHEFMAGVTLMWDFTWSVVMGKRVRLNERTFTGCKKLMALVAKECKAVTGGQLRPALVLTIDATQPEGPRQENGYYAVVVNIHEYLGFARDRTRANDLAATYFALRCTTPISRLPRVQDLDLSPEAVEKLRPVVSANRAKFTALATLFQEEGVELTTGPRSASDLLTALSALTTISDSDLNQLVSVLERFGTRDSRRRAIETLLAFADGRSAAIEHLGHGIRARIQDARTAIVVLTAAINEPEALERVFQEQIGRHPWILGLHYVAAFPQRDIGGSPVDFLLRRMDGRHDIVELKRAHHRVVEIIPSKVNHYRGRPNPAPAHAYQIGPELANALAQTHSYRDWLSALGPAATHKGLHVNENPIITIIIGRYSDLSDVEKLIFEQFRRSLVRVHVVCYDELARQAGIVLDGVEQHLVAAQDVLGRGEAEPEPDDEEPVAGGVGDAEAADATGVA